MTGYPYVEHWHLAGSLVSLRNAINAHWPHRDHSSDGAIGDERHAAGGPGHPGWTASDHNPWLNDCVRALDVDVDGIDAKWLAEELRKLGAAGDPRLRDGGYIILDGQITAPDFSHWTAYNGPDPHTSHLHVSASRDVAGYEYTGPWQFLASCPGPVAPPAVVPAPRPAPPVEHVPAPTAAHPDLRGEGDSLRGEIGDQGPRVAKLERDLDRYAPAYSHLAIDGVYDQEDVRVLAEFGHREADDPTTPAADRPGLHTADGRNIGPRLAHALGHDGLI